MIRPLRAVPIVMPDTSLADYATWLMDHGS